MPLSTARDEHNPLYLLSAALVLAGCTLWSNSLSGVSGPVIAALLAEVYALCLVGGVALLTRIELRRPAVMLALLALLYQWDLTFHTETAVFLGDTGYATTAVWAALFVGKLHLLERALRIRLAPHAWLAALLAAAGLALGPRVLPWLGERGAGSLVALWFFGLGVLAQRQEATLTAPADAELDVDPTLLRRLTRATWWIPAALLAAHLLFLAKDHRIGLVGVVVTAPLLLVRRVRDERAAWLLVAISLIVAMPGALAVTALLSAAALLLRAFAPQLPRVPAQPARPAPLSNEVSLDPYRLGGAPPEVAPAVPTPLPPVVAAISTAERDRLVVGAVFALHLSAWTLGWTGGTWPVHRLLLDLLLAAAVLGVTIRSRRAYPLLPLAACWIDLGMRAHVLSLPRSGAQWGLTAVSLGFLLLGGSLATSYRRATRRGERRDHALAEARELHHHRALPLR